jgi:hypothetical protein
MEGMVPRSIGERSLLGSEYTTRRHLRLRWSRKTWDWRFDATLYLCLTKINRPLMMLDGYLLLPLPSVTSATYISLRRKMVWYQSSTSLRGFPPSNAKKCHSLDSFAHDVSIAITCLSRLARDSRPSVLLSCSSSGARSVLRHPRSLSCEVSASISLAL